MAQGRRICFPAGSLAAAVLGLAVAAAVQPSLRAARGSGDAAALEGAPPAVVFTTVVLGGFRGLLADVLWLRVSHLQDRGEFFELVQMADWITKLEPHNAEVWSFHAWNLAYNVSAAFSRPEDRWRWVRRGVELLRDEGVRVNPREPRLRCELGWLFQHKIGGRGDAGNAEYRRRFALEMNELLGGAASPCGNGVEGTVPAVLRRRMRMDPELVCRVEALYGPLDWRLPEAHAVYWAYTGRKLPGADIACDRMIFQSLASAFERGRLAFPADGGAPVETPNLDLLPGVMRAYEEALARHGSGTIRDAYAYFLLDALVVLTDLGREDDADRAFAALRQVAPERAGPTADVTARAWRQEQAQP